VQVAECLGTDLGPSTLPQTRLATIAQRSGIPFVDLLPALRNAGREGPTYFAGEGIWTARGHEAAADIIGLALRATIRR
jgi:hypothetical protein